MVPDRSAGQPTNAVPLRLMPWTSTPARLERSLASTAIRVVVRFTLWLFFNQPLTVPSPTMLFGSSGLCSQPGATFCKVMGLLRRSTSWKTVHPWL
jgi:hypothetical protein